VFTKSAPFCIRARRKVLLGTLADMAANGRPTRIIDPVHPLDDLDAVRRDVETRHKGGTLVVA
jgi:hypothetical protein